MKHLFIVLVLLLHISSVKILAQGTNQFSKEEIEKANTAVKAKYLTAEEKEVIRYMNLARMDGKKFFDSYIQDFVDAYNVSYSPKIKPSNSYIKSLKKDLYKTKDLPLILPNEKLSKSAAYHAKDMGKKGSTGHDSSDGTNFINRMKKMNGTVYYVSENCDYGFNKGLDIVCHLLIDNNYKSLGHRKNILDKEQRYVGIGIREHKVYQFNCVTDFYSNPDNKPL